VTEKATLLLVDVQEDFLARPGLTPDRATLIATLSSLLKHARSSGWRVVHVHTRVDADLSNAMPHRRDPARAEVIAGTPGAEPPTELAPIDGEALLFKRFFSAFDAPDLEEQLRIAGPGPIVVAGVHGHACIRDTVTDAYRLGFEVVIPEAATASYDSAHAAMALGWIDGRSARVAPLEDLLSGGAAASEWVQLDPCNQRRELQRVRLTPAAEVHDAATALELRQPSLEALGLDGRRELLSSWRERLEQSREAIRDALVRDVAKPLRDADGELAYGLALLDDVVDRLAEEDGGDGRVVRYRPLGLVGLITPWNNPFAIAVGKIAPALAYGNAALWKPALAASGISALLADSLAESGLGDWVAMLPGDSGTGEAVVSDERVAALSFTGSVAVGRRLIARAGVRAVPAPVQAELGGSNAAIIDPSADLNAAAADLPAAMFSFSGQRCTAIRRLILVGDIAETFTERLVAEVRALKLGLPSDPGTDLGPLIDRPSRQRLLGGIEKALADGGRLLCGGGIPDDLPPDGCWMEPALIDGLGSDHPLGCEEWFGPLGSLVRVANFDEAIKLHNRTGFGLLGALYATDDARIAQFTAKAEAGILSVGRARPPFSSAGPFYGWKGSGYGIAEHGRWNRDFYTRPQAIYRS
jgi:acyl-CoA reductase-like NAD-dependent aldehyde dehydrogenase/nicotinamidase-related amidase